MNKIKIVIISDTHNKHNEIKLPDADLLIHCGDHSSLGKIQELVNFNKWLGNIKHKYQKIIIIPGNHDFLYQTNEGLARNLVPNAEILIDQTTQYNGLKIYGSPWQPEFFDWAFNLPRGEQLRQVWDKIPEDTDILITHGPPHGIMDFCQNGHVGCQDLLERVKKLPNLKLHCFGHIHEGHGSEFHEFKRNETIQNNTVQFVNASILDDRYKIKYSPIIVDMPLKQSK